MKIEAKILNGLERISEVLKSLLWEKAKVHGISPIQIQILLFVEHHKTEICNVSYLAKEFNVTKATISDAVRVLVRKDLLDKDFSPRDNRRYNLLLSVKGKELVKDLVSYAFPIENELSTLKEQDLAMFFDVITKLIYQLNQKGIIQVQRICYNCRFYSGDKNAKHYCTLLDQRLQTSEVRIDCHEFEA